jgi:hypothetical protein
MPVCTGMTPKHRMTYSTHFSSTTVAALKRDHADHELVGIEWIVQEEK